MDSQPAGEFFTPRLHGKGPPHRCLGPSGDNPCHVCSVAPQVYPNAARCCYRDGTMQCCCCLGFDFDVQVRCATCRAAWCIRCNCNELRCLCPICDRAALNQTRPCSMCSQQVRIAKHGYVCVECHVVNMCETCYGVRRCCLGTAENDVDMTSDSSYDTSESTSDNEEII